MKVQTMPFLDIATGFALAGLLMTGCGATSGTGSLAQMPVSVALNPSTVVVVQNGTPTYAQIEINSTSETALVSFEGLPSGVQATYQASDTNPSGLLTFEAKTQVTAGTYMPIVSVNTAGQTAMIGFTMIVPAK